MIYRFFAVMAALCSISQAAPLVTYFKGSDGGAAHQYKNPCKVVLQADPALSWSKDLYLNQQSYSFPVEARPALGWKAVSAKYLSNFNGGNEVTIDLGNAMEPAPFQIPSRLLPNSNYLKIVTVRFATQRRNPDGTPEHQEDVIIYAKVVPNLATYDANGNSLFDFWEIQNFGNLGVDPYDDPDHDGLTNLREMQEGSNPWVFTDTIYDAAVDTDSDNIPDEFEMGHFGDLSNSGSTVVPNSGGLTVQQLYKFYIQELQSSTVRDGIPDGWKQKYGIDINDLNAANRDPDQDNLNNGEEYDAQLDPKKPDYDNDGLKDGEDPNPKILNPSVPPNPKVVVPDWEVQAASDEPDYANVDFTKIELQWEPSSYSPKYRIERKVNSNPWEQLAEVSALKYADQNLLGNKHYQYRITAYRTSGAERAYSNSVILNYQVPLNLKMDVKSTGSYKSKKNYRQYADPAPGIPPNYYLNVSSGGSTQGSYISTTKTETTLSYNYTQGTYTYTLSGLYTTQNLKADVLADLSYPAEWTENWWGWGYYDWGYWGYDGYGYEGEWYPWGYGWGWGWWGWWTANRYLSQDESSFTVSKSKYRFRISPSAACKIKWYVLFTPEDDPTTPNIDESSPEHVEFVREEVWNVAEGQTQSPEYEMADAVNIERDGYYSIMMQPTTLTAPGVGEAGKDIIGNDAEPGRVALINDGDLDNDGVVDYADGYDLNSQISQDGQIGAFDSPDWYEDDRPRFIPLYFTGYAFDAENAKVRFTYDASDPAQVTSSAGNPFQLPVSGKIRIWKKNAWEQRNSQSVENGGDFVKPNVEYTFEELSGGGDSYYNYTYYYPRLYVEAVKTSGAVADIPIKVEVDPTGSMGYVWSDQVRFTGSKIEIESKGLKDLPFATTPVLRPASLKNYYENMAIFAAPAKPFAISRAKITDPRQNLNKATIGHTDLSLSHSGGVWTSQEFVGIRPNSGSSKPLEQVQAPIIPDRASVEAGGTTYNKPLLPYPIRDVKKVNDETDDVVIEGIPPKTPDEEDDDYDNAYIQRPLSDRQVAFIEPHGAPDGIAPEMPHLVAKLPGEPSHDLKVRWRLEVDYQRLNGWRSDYANPQAMGREDKKMKLHPEAYHLPEDLVRIPYVAPNAAPIFTAEMPADQEWRIFETQDWQNELAQKGFFGGTAKLYIWYPINGAEPTEPFMTFRIGGKNPTIEKAKTFIQSHLCDNRLWFAYAIAKKESPNYEQAFYNQFFGSYRKRKGNGYDQNMDWQCWAKGWPVYNIDRDTYNNGPLRSAGGYGIFQVTGDKQNQWTAIPRRQIWNWQDNIGYQENGVWKGAMALLKAKIQFVDARYNALQQTYSNCGPIPNYPENSSNKKKFSGWDAYVCKAFNGMGGTGDPIRINGFKYLQACVWHIENGAWKFKDDGYTIGVWGQVEDTN